MSMKKIAGHVSTKITPQSEPIPGKPMVPNSAGGYSFVVDQWTRLDRFLILGSEGGTYYIAEKKLTQDNAKGLLACLKEDFKRTINRIVEVSDKGLAPKNTPAVFALALCAGVGAPEARKYALEQLDKVCRIGTDLFHFNEAVEQFRGRGRQLNRAIANWYTNKKPSDLAYQLVKYQQRDGWANRDLLRLTKPKVGGRYNTLFKWAVGKANMEDIMGTEGLELIVAFEQAKTATEKKTVCRLIRDYRLPRECIPTEMLKEPDVWAALLEQMPMTAMIRNLATMTKVGVLAPMSLGAGHVIRELTNTERLHKSRIHPIALLIALKVYAQGKGMKGDNTWNPVPQIVDALDGAFYKAFGNVEVTGKRHLFGIDVSSSMGAECGGTPLTCCEGATAMALTVAHTEPQYGICAFTHRFTPLPISARTRLDDALKHTRNVNFGGTDCSLPMIWALEKKMPVDAFIVVTDSETWAGQRQPVQALDEYRQKMGIGSKLVVVGMAANPFTIADPSDAGMMDVVGFSADVPTVIGNFVK